MTAFDYADVRPFILQLQTIKLGNFQRSLLLFGHDLDAIVLICVPILLEGPLAVVVIKRDEVIVDYLIDLYVANQEIDIREALLELVHRPVANEIV